MHGAVLQVESALVTVDKVQLPLHVGDVGLQHGFHLRGGGRLLLQQLPLGLQHFVLLLQVSHLRHKESTHVPDKLTGLQLLF